MPLRSSRLLTTLLLVLALVLAACGGGDADDDATEEPTEAAEATTPEPTEDAATEEPEAEATATEEATDDAGGEGAGDDDPIREQAVAEFLAAGLTEEDANCVIDVYAAEGVSMEDVAAVGNGQAPADPAAFAAASANLGQCLSPEELGAFADTAANQDPEAVRAAFIQGFVATGATEEQAGCIFDELTAAGFTLGDLSAAGTNPPPELQEAATAAGETCGIN